MAMLSLALNVYIVKKYPSLPSSLIITVGTALITFIGYLFTKSDSVGPSMFYFFQNFGGTLIPETVAASGLQANMSKYKFIDLNNDQVEKFVQQYLPVIGHIEPGLPKFSIPKIFNPSEAPLIGFWIVTPVILVILLGFMESISISKKYAEILNYPLNCNQELIALGIANLGGSFFGCYSVAGSFSRTAVNQKSGATSLFASLITAGLLAVFLYGFTFLLYYVPKCTLAVILFLAVYGLIDFKLIKSYIRHKKYLDLFFFFAVFAATCCFGTTYGLIVGTVLNIFQLILKKRKGESLTPGGESKKAMLHSNDNLVKEDNESSCSSSSSSSSSAVTEQKLRLMEENKLNNESKESFDEIEMQKL